MNTIQLSFSQSKAYAISFLKCMAFLSLINPFVSLSGQEKIIDEIVAIVGERIILASDIEVQYQQAKAQGMEDNGDLKCQIIDQLLLEKMFQTHAQIDSLEVGEGELENELDGRIRYFISMFGGDVEKMEEFYGKSAAKIKEEFREDVKEQLLARKMQSQILANISITPSEVKAFFETIPKDSIPYFNAEIELAQLVIMPKVRADKKEAARQQLLGFKKQIEDGADFAKLAELHSIDPGSAANGGDLGWVERGQFVAEFEGAAFRLKAGELSEPIESSFGLHLIQLLERRGDKIHTRHILIKPEITEDDLDDTANKLDSIRNLILIDTLNFKEAVEKFSDDDETKGTGGLIFNPNTNSTLFEMDQIDPSLYFAIDTLDENETSKPIQFQMRDGSQAFRILHVYTRTEPHLANLKDDYNKLQSVVEMQKQQQTMLDWLNRRIPTTYIKLQDKYQTCEMLEKWNVRND